MTRIFLANETGQENWTDVSFDVMTASQRIAFIRVSTLGQILDFISSDVTQEYYSKGCDHAKELIGTATGEELLSHGTKLTNIPALHTAYLGRMSALKRAKDNALMATFGAKTINELLNFRNTTYDLSSQVSLFLEDVIKNKISTATAIEINEINNRLLLTGSKRIVNTRLLALGIVPKALAEIRSATTRQQLLAVNRNNYIEDAWITDWENKLNEFFNATENLYELREISKMSMRPSNRVTIDKKIAFINDKKISSKEKMDTMNEINSMELLLEFIEKTNTFHERMAFEKAYHRIMKDDHLTLGMDKRKQEERHMAIISTTNRAELRKIMLDGCFDLWKTWSTRDYDLTRATRNLENVRGIINRAPHTTNKVNMLFGVEVESTKEVECDENIWNQISDGSVGGYGKEYVLLKNSLLKVNMGEDSIGVARKFFNLLNPLFKAGIGQDASTGIHFHFSIEGRKFKKAELEKISLAFEITEDLFYSIVPESRRNNRYCLPLQKGMYRNLKLYMTNGQGTVRRNKYDNSFRYNWLSFENVLRPNGLGTVEIRLLGNSSMSRTILFVTLMHEVLRTVFNNTKDVNAMVSNLQHYKEHFLGNLDNMLTDIILEFKLSDRAKETLIGIISDAPKYLMRKENEKVKKIEEQRSIVVKKWAKGEKIDVQSFRLV